MLTVIVQNANKLGPTEFFIYRITKWQTNLTNRGLIQIDKHWNFKKTGEMSTTSVGGKKFLTLLRPWPSFPQLMYLTGNVVSPFAFYYLITKPKISQKVVFD